MSSEQGRMGLMNNREIVRDWLIDGLKASTKIGAGRCTTLDGANGRIVTTAATAANLVRITEVASDNDTTTNLAKLVSTFKGGAIAIVEAGGAIPIGSEVYAGADGEVFALAAITSASTNAEIVVHVANKLGVYLGHYNEVWERENNPTAAVDGDFIFVRFY